MKKFSIIIPAHNAEDRIRVGLESIRQQTYKDYEIIVVCDSCEDDTEIVAREYTNKVYSIEAHNDGLSRNKGIEAAEGEYILFMDDDDSWPLEFQLEALARKISKINADVIAMSFYMRGCGYRAPGDNRGYLYPNVWSKCWKRSAIGDTRFENVKNVSDLKFCQAMSAKELNYYIWDFPWYDYNFMRPGSLSYKLLRGENDDTRGS